MTCKRMPQLYLFYIYIYALLIIHILFSTSSFEVPLTHKNPNTSGMNAPLVRKSEPIHAMVKTDLICKAIIKAT